MNLQTARTKITVKRNRFVEGIGIGEYSSNQNDVYSCAIGVDATAGELVTAFYGLLVCLGYHPDSIKDAMRAEAE